VYENKKELKTFVVVNTQFRQGECICFVKNK